MNELNTSKLVKRCNTADFSSVEEFNSAIKILSRKLKYKNDAKLSTIETDTSNSGIDN